MYVIADFDSPEGLELAKEALRFVVRLFFPVIL
jgi:hypothetical protein